VYATVFAGFLPAHFDWPFAALLVPAVFIVEAAWYSFVSLVLSADRPRRIYSRFKTVADRLAALALGALGVKLITEGASDLLESR